MTQKNTGSTAL